MTRTARAYWLASPGPARSDSGSCRTRVPGEVLVRTLVSGVSRGTESLVFRGGVPESQYAAMRAPFQEGDFPAPVKYGYLSVGVVEAGPDDLLGRTVFCLHPHQTAYVVPAEAVSVVPDDVPPRRAVLAGTRRDRGQRALGRPPAGRRPGRRRRCRHGRLLRGPPARRRPRCRGDRRRHRRLARRGRRVAGRRLRRPPDDAPTDLDLVVHASGTVGRAAARPSTCSAPTASSPT